MALPQNFDTIELVGQYVDFLGNPPPTTPEPGRLDFEPTADMLKHIDSKLLIFKAVRSATLQADGAFTIRLPITNDPDIVPTFMYSVRESIPGAAKRTYTIEIPVTLLPGPVNIADVITVGEVPTGTTALTRQVADTLYAPKGSTGGGGSATAEASEATANTLALRDANGRTKFATPSEAGHAATKGYVDTQISSVTEAIGGANQAVSGLETRVSGVETDVADLETDLGGVAARVTALETEGQTITVQLVGNAAVPIGTDPGALILRRQA